MSLNKTALAFALAIQLGLVAVLLAARAGSDVAPEPFLNFDADSVDSVTVANAEGDIRLAKGENGWQLPDGVPADGDKVKTALDKLAEADGGWPVANSAATAERFEVTEDNHQRHIQLAAGDDTLADFYLGTSPGYRKVHARRADDDAVYAIGFANYEAGVTASDWLDRSLLQAEGTITGLRRVDGFGLAKDDDGDWTVANGEAPAGGLDAGKTETLAGRFTGLSVLGISDADLPDAPHVAFSLDDEAGELLLSVYRFRQAPADEAGEADEDAEVRYDYVATSNRVTGTYEISSYVAEQMDVTLADLAGEPADDAAGDDSDEGNTEDAAADGTEIVSEALAPTGG